MGLIDPLVTNLENGLSTRNAADIFGPLKYPDPTRYASIFDDFLGFAPGAVWDVVGNSAVLPALLSVGGGVLQLATDTPTSGTVALLPAGNAVGATGPMSMEAGRPVYYGVRMRLNEIIGANFIFGIINADYDPAAAFEPTDGAWFSKLGFVDTNIDFSARNIIFGAADTDVDVATLVDDEFFSAEFVWDGEASVYYSINGVVQGSVSLTAFNAPATPLVPFLAVLEGSLGAIETDIDYLFAAQERV